MGYYDDDQKQRKQSRKGGSKAGYFLSSLSGLIIGALIVMLALPQLSNYGILPDAVDSSITSNNTTETTTTPVSYDVSSDVTAAVEKAGDAVVGITNLQSGSSMFGQSTEEQEAGTGSGVIYKKDGDTAYIVTNNHVVEGAQSLEVTLADGTKVEAEMLGGDVWTDLAVLTIDGSDVDTVAEFGDSSALKAGEPVIAIGNPLGLQFSGSVTTGVVSGVDRTIPVDVNGDGASDWQAEVLQTDAAINPGNSGGALVNINGQVIGINSMKIAESSVEGIGLAIPINSAQSVIEDLETKGEVERPTMGVTLVDLANVPSQYQQSELNLPEEVQEGVVIQRVVENSPAANAGLQDMDVIVEMDGKKITNTIELRQHLYNEKNVGDDMTVKVYRNGEMQEVTLTLTDDAQL